MDVNTNKKFCLKVHDKTQNTRDKKNKYLLLFSMNKIKNIFLKRKKNCKNVWSICKYPPTRCLMINQEGKIKK